MRPERVARMVRAYGIDVARWPEAGDLPQHAEISPDLLSAAASVDAALIAMSQEPPALGIFEDEALAEAAIVRSLNRRWDRWPIRAAAASVVFAAVLGAATGSINEMSRVDAPLFSTKQGLWSVQVRLSTGGME